MSERAELKRPRMVLNPLMYRDLQRPNGFLSPEPACHALWHYYIIASNNIGIQEGQIVYEGDLDPKYNFHQLFKSIGFMYGVEPEQMIQAWPAVDLQAAVMNFPKMPQGYRFDSKLIVKGN